MAEPKKILGFERFLRQRVEESTEPADTDARLLALAESLEGALQGHLEHIADVEEAEEVPPAASAEAAPAPGADGRQPAIPALGLSL